uniref:Fe2OG dioxygenase domain-containing protein n=1 Tax=Salix viminalis TaxID=40686 RepID=A0A6N2MAI0_SALVM
MEEEKALLRRIFGDSSDSEDKSEEKEDSIDDVGCQFTSDPNCPTWEQVNEIKGLWLCRDFLSPHQQSTLLSAIQNEGWFLEAPNNQAMRFGDLPSWAIELSNSIREVILYGDRIHEPPKCAGSDRGEAACWLPPDLLSREPFFDQLIANVYQPGEGICAHVDLMRFEDGIAIVSLESSCVMHFTQVGEVSGSGKEQPDLPMIKIPVFLMPGSLVLLFGDARYLWKHEINRKPGFQMWQGQEVNQKRRTSITLRKLCHAE